MILKGLRLELCKHFFRVLLALLITLRHETRALPEPALPNASASEQTISHLPGPRLVLTFGGGGSPGVPRSRLSIVSASPLVLIARVLNKPRKC